MVIRPSKDEYYLGIAKAVTTRATCLRRHYGAIIVRDDQIVSSGYCGAPRGVKNCCDIGKCLREELKVPSGERYELCRSVHAEMNAVINAARSGACVIDGKMYVYGYDVKKDCVCSGKPCKLCTRVIINAGISKVITSEEKGITEYSLADLLKITDI